MNSVLTLNSLRVMVALGWTAEERQRPQAVDFDVAVRFADLPPACESDELADTVCYSVLAQLIEAQCRDRSFKLIEHLTRQVYGVLVGAVPPEAALWVRVTKVSPPLTGLQRGASFCYGNWQPPGISLL